MKAKFVWIYSVFVLLAFSVVQAYAGDSYNDYISEGFELKAVSEVGGESPGTNLWLQKDNRVVFCPLFGVVGKLPGVEDTPAMQMFPCTELVVDAAFMRELQENQGKNK